ncbi:prolyl oligopeptidase family serine peptidase [Xanthocytophaga agilis]|uniref:Prolyl oligopeptidase family serine peptidase n=1 Tax=Xanthocytophaga agilis TaxID=3048010 RepID=A0AAE3UG34_9BACT|nr:prolyl oligopeptidase family serine peptidase [Xanthocytophaga agilis]MDJ1504493.1 prolyl oligopeptidase family serine peptidase [Xanthocytophaga agilis]
MKHLNLLFIFFLFSTGFTYAQKRESGNLLLENIPMPVQEIQERLEQYQNVRAASLADWDAIGKSILISTRFGDANQIHKVSFPGGDRQQITFEKEPVSNASVCPDPSNQGFIFLRDVGGNENYQLYYFDLASSQKRLLTDGKSRHGNLTWNHKGDKYLYTSNHRNAGDLDIYEAQLNDPSKNRMIFQGKGGGWQISDWSADEQQLLVQEYISINESRLYLLNTTGTMEEFNPSKKQIAYSNAQFSKDRKGFFFLSDEDNEFMQLRFYDFSTKKITNLTQKINWDVDNLELSKSGKWIAFTTNEGGYSKLYILDTQNNQYQFIESIPNGVIGSMRFNPDNERLALTINSATIPSDVFVVNIRSGKLDRWTFSETGGLKVSDFTEPTLIEYPTFDKVNGKSRMIPAFLFTPKNISGKAPIVISIHGGPESQSLPTFNSLIQFWVNEMKIAVLVPNVRGSSGYGKTYLKLDNGILRENSVKDIGSLLDWVEKQPNLDAQRVSVYGGSYGGYMSLACMTHFNARLRCGIDLFGISNFVTFLKNTSPYRQDLRRAEYGDERDPKMNLHLEQISPLTNIKNITKPMLIFQGKNDPRVPISESEQMVNALKNNSNSVWYIMAKDEGHGITKKANRDQVNVAIAQFLEKFLIEELPK